jgi:hypothetical protein
VITLSARINTIGGIVRPKRLGNLQINHQFKLRAAARRGGVGRPADSVEDIILYTLLTAYMVSGTASIALDILLFKGSSSWPIH